MYSTFNCGRTTLSRCTRSTPLSCGITTSVTTMSMDAQVALADRQGGHAVGGLQHVVALRLQRPAGQLPHRLLVLHQQDRFLAGRRRGGA